MTLRLAGSTGLVLLLAACVPPPAPTPPPVAAPAPTPSPAPLPPPVAQVVTSELPANWADQPRTEGDWSYQQPEGATLAYFRNPSGERLLSVACSIATRRVSIMRYVAGLPRSVTIDLRTETASRTSTRDSDELGAGWAFMADDPLLDAMAFSKGHFAVGVTGVEPIYPPSYPEITRVIEDCR